MIVQTLLTPEQLQAELARNEQRLDILERWLKEHQYEDTKLQQSYAERDSLLHRNKAIREQLKDYRNG